MHHKKEKKYENTLTAKKVDYAVIFPFFDQIDR